MRYSILCYLFLVSMTVWGQQQPHADFLKAQVHIAIDTTNKQIKGSVKYDLVVDKRIDSVFLDAKNMQFKQVLLNGRSVKYKATDSHIIFYKKFKPEKKYYLELVYVTIPKQTVYFIGWEDEMNNNQIWTQGQGKYTSYWLPSIDDMVDKIEFDLSIQFDASYVVIANGRLISKVVNEQLTTWNYDMQQPMSSYLVAFAIGKYKSHQLVSKNNTPIELYYYPGDSLKIKPTYKYTSQIFEMLEDKIGVPYPWQNYKQVPVRDFLYAGMENTGTTIFSDAFVIDSIAFIDQNYVNVNAHEMAHQWFGNLVTEVDASHHWLHEGFATYYAYLIEKELFGAEHVNWILFEKAHELQAQFEAKRNESLLDPKAGSLTFYEKGAWALYALNKLLGEKAFEKGIQNYLAKYKYAHVTVDQFLNEMETASGIKLQAFKELWLIQEDFPYAQAMDLLAEASKEVHSFLEMKSKLSTSVTGDEATIGRYWLANRGSKFRATTVQHYYKHLSNEFIREVLETGDLKVRQAIILKTDRIPLVLKKEYETLLEDPSYMTIENALYKLWVQFPESRKDYLNATRDIKGLPNKNIRLLWLLLASLTNDFDTIQQRKVYIEELRSYTDPKYNFEIRQNAFALTDEVLTLDEQNLKDLINACVHDVWQFRNFARKLLDKNLQNEQQKERLNTISKELKGKELRYLLTKLSEE